MGGYGDFVKLLREQKALYEELSAMAENMNAALRGGEDTAALLDLMSSRDTSINKINENDARISGIVNSGEGAGWLERDEAAGLVRRLRQLVSRVMELDEEGRKALEEARKETRMGLGDLSNTRRGVAGYGLKDKRPSARFKDIKL